jgi:hypothetical protein
VRTDLTTKTNFTVKKFTFYIGMVQTNEHLYQNYLPYTTRQAQYKKYSPEALTPPSGSYSHLLLLETGISAQSAEKGPYLARTSPLATKFLKGGLPNSSVEITRRV